MSWYRVAMSPRSESQRRSLCVLVSAAAVAAVACDSSNRDEPPSGMVAPPSVGASAAGNGVAGAGAGQGTAGSAGMRGASAGTDAAGMGASDPSAGAGGAGSGGAGTGGVIAGTGGVSAGTGGSRAGTGGMTAGTGGGTGDCPHVQMAGEDFCTIGDSWIQIPGNQVTTLENHLVMAGVIPQGDHFDRREVSGSRLSAIIDTYDRQPDNCKVLIMDGGGIDLFTTPAGNEAAVAPVVQAFEDFLGKVAADGFVQHVLYSLYPVIPSTPNLNANMKPGFSAACAASAVPCVLVDLEPLFMGQHIAGDRTHADQAGGVNIGDAWWAAMQDNCIAQ